MPGSLGLGRGSDDASTGDRRFHHSLTDHRRWIRERSHESYAKNYAVVFPHDEPLAGRNMRTDPLHEVRLAAGSPRRWVLGRQCLWGPACGGRLARRRLVLGRPPSCPALLSISPQSLPEAPPPNTWPWARGFHMGV